MKGSTYGKTVCASFFFFKRQMPACESWDGPCCIWASVRGRSQYECVQRSPQGLFLTSFPIDFSSLNTVKCQVFEYLYTLLTFSCCLIWCECCIWLCALFSPCCHPFCENDFVLVRFVWEKALGELESVLSSSLMWCVFDKFPLKVCVWRKLWMLFYVLWIKGKSEIKLILT